MENAQIEMNLHIAIDICEARDERSDIESTICLFFCVLVAGFV